MEMIQHLAKTQGQVIKIKEVIFVTMLNILGNMLLSMDLIDFEGKGVGEEMMKNLRRFTETGATPGVSRFISYIGCFHLESSRNI